MNDPSNHSRPWTIWLTAIVSVVVVCIEIMPEIIKLVREGSESSVSAPETEGATDVPTSALEDSGMDVGEVGARVDRSAHTIESTVEDSSGSFSIDGNNPTIVPPPPTLEELVVKRAIEKVKGMSEGTQIELPSSRTNYTVVGVQKDGEFWAFSRSILLELIDSAESGGSESSVPSVVHIVEVNEGSGERTLSEVQRGKLSRKLAKAIDSGSYTSSYVDPDVNW
ncbi:MAG: hypothetical protein AAF716_10215 [Cyanobacteria bacterium P01_D01_bin.1]